MTINTVPNPRFVRKDAIATHAVSPLGLFLFFLIFIPAMILVFVFD
jgi:hypothetical protein